MSNQLQELANETSQPEIATDEELLKYVDRPGYVTLLSRDPIVFSAAWDRCKELGLEDRFKKRVWDDLVTLDNLIAKLMAT